MGAFLVNFHVRTESQERVRETLKALLTSGGWMTGPHQGWVSFWEQQASQQNVERIKHIAQHVSESTKQPVVAFLVHDSDIFCYWLYDAGRQLDEYNSCPSYWGDDQIDEAALTGDVDTLATFCRPGTKPEQLRELLKQQTAAGREAGESPAFVFAEEGLMKLSELLELREDVVLVDFSDVELAVSAEELDAEWVGQGKRPESQGSSDEESSAGSRGSLPNAPLHDAAQRDDFATIKSLINAGTDVNAIPRGYEVTALAIAAAYGSSATIRALVERGADLHKKGREGATPIRFAVQSGRIENVRALAELAADVSDYNPQMGTLLHLAAVMSSPPELVSVLLEIGVDASRTNEAGLKAIDIVRGNKGAMEELRSMLLKSGKSKEGDRSNPLDDHCRRLEEIERILNVWPE